MFLLVSVTSEKNFKPRKPIHDNKILILTPWIREENLLFDQEERARVEKSGSFVQGQGKSFLSEKQIPESAIFFTPQSLPEVLAQQVSWGHHEAHSEFKA